MLIASKFVGVRWELMLGTLALKVEHPYILRKSEKSLDMDEPTFHAKKLHRLQQQTEVRMLALARQNTLENGTKDNKGCSAQKDKFTEHCIIRLQSAHDLVLLL